MRPYRETLAHANNRHMLNIVRISLFTILLSLLLLGDIRAAYSDQGIEPGKADQIRFEGMLRDSMNLKLNEEDADVNRLNAQIAAARLKLEQLEALQQKIHQLQLELAALPKVQVQPPPPRQDLTLVPRMQAAQTAITTLTPKKADLTTQIDNEHALDAQLKTAQDEATFVQQLQQARPNDDSERQTLTDRITVAKAAVTAEQVEITQAAADLTKEEQDNPVMTESYVDVTGITPNLRTTYIECKSDGITIYKIAGSTVQQIAVANSDIDTSKDLSAVSSSVIAGNKAGGNQVLMFLVRPGSVRTYDDARVTVSKAGAPWASMPISSNCTVQVCSVSITAAGE